MGTRLPPVGGLVVASLMVASLVVAGLALTSARVVIRQARAEIRSANGTQLPVGLPVVVNGGARAAIASPDSGKNASR